MKTKIFNHAWRDLEQTPSNLQSRGVIVTVALLLTAAVVLYDFAALDLIQFCFIFSAHFALGWIYLFLSQLFLPRMDSTPPKDNPFKAAHIR